MEKLAPVTAGGTAMMQDSIPILHVTLKCFLQCCTHPSNFTGNSIRSFCILDRSGFGKVAVNEFLTFEEL